MNWIITSVVRGEQIQAEQKLLIRDKDRMSIEVIRKNLQRTFEVSFAHYGKLDIVTTIQATSKDKFEYGKECSKMPEL